MNKPIVTGLMAYGMSGKVFHAPFIDQHPGFKLQAVLERSKKLAQSDYPDIVSYNSRKDLVNNPEIEFIIVNTPNNTHYEFAKEALLAGKHVLIEKPMTVTASDAREIFDLGKKVNKKVLIYQNRRWASDFISTKQVLESGRLGRIIEIHLRFDRYRHFIGPKVFKETPVPGSGILYDLGAHLLDQVISMYGRPVFSHKTLGKYRPGSQVDDYANMHLQFANQLNVFITLSMLAADPQPGIVIHGSKGSFIKSFCDTQEEQLIAGMKPNDKGFGEEPQGKEGRLTTINENGEKIVELIPSAKGGYMDLFESVFQSIRHDKNFPVKEDDIITQIELLEQKVK